MIQDNFTNLDELVELGENIESVNEECVEEKMPSVLDTDKVHLLESNDKDTFSKVDKKSCQQMYFDVNVPDDYVVTIDGVWKKVTVKDPLTKELVEIYQKICESRVLPTGIFVDQETGTNIVELTYISDTGLEKLHVPWSVSLGSKEWKDHIRVGDFSNLEVDDEELPDVRKFLRATKKANINVYNGPGGTKFKTGNASMRVGWQGEGFEKFSIGSKIYTKYGEESAFFVDVKHVEAIKRVDPKGNLVGWINTVRPVIHYPALRFAIYYAVGILLLGPTKSPNNEFGIIGDTSQGKTFTLMIVASIFGNPDPLGTSLIISGENSTTAINAIMTTMTDFLLFIDEIGRMKESSRDDLAYGIGNGHENLRGKTDGTLRNSRMIRTCAIITGEVPPVSDKAHNGSLAGQFRANERLIPEIDGRIVEAVKKQLVENYGQVLPLILKKIFNIGKKNLENQLSAALDRLYGTTKDPILRRKAAYFATVDVAGKIVENVFSEIGIQPLNSQEIVEKAWRDYVLGEPDIPLEIKALEDVYNTAHRNAKNFLVNSEEPNGNHPDDIYGWWVGKRNTDADNFEYLDLNQTWVEDLLHKLNYDDPKNILKYWRYHLITECNINETNGTKCIDGVKRELTTKIKHNIKKGQPAVYQKVIRIKVLEVMKVLKLTEDSKK